MFFGKYSVCGTDESCLCYIITNKPCTLEVTEERDKLSFFKKRFYLLIFRERGREGEREGEKHQCVVASCTPPTGDLVYNTGMYPDWEWN